MTQEVTVVFHPLNKVVSVPRGTNLLAAFREAGVQIESICGGKGECGKCRVIIDKGEYAERAHTHKKHLTEKERALGYRLACEISVTGNLEVTVPVESRIERPQILIGLGMGQDAGEINPSVVIYPLQISADPGLPFSGRSIRLSGYRGPRPQIPDAIYRKIQASEAPLKAILTHTNGYPEIIDAAGEDDVPTVYGIALDLGTTTVVGTLIDLATGCVLAQDATLNRQITYGEEVITRIAFGRRPEGLALLQQAAVESINRVVESITASAGIRPADAVECCIGGNTVMNHLLTGTDPGYLELADADVSRRPFIRKARALGIGLHPEAYCYCLPNVSRFVGGDAVGDVLTSGLHLQPEISLLIDLGTNGEIIIGNRDWIASASCASGPAFEGAGISVGMRAMRGAIERVEIDPDTGEASVQVIGGTLPRGICGSGLIDAVTGMFRAGILDFKGYLNTHPLVRDGHAGAEYVLVPAEATATGRDIVITQQDMDYFMDSKAALCGAIGVLLKKYRLTVADIRHVYLAGAFGAFADLQNAVAFGIIPSFPNAETHSLGNGSLSGAYAALMSLEKRAEAEKIAEMLVYIDLLVDVDFIEEYTAALFIPGKKAYFPDIEA